MNLKRAKALYGEIVARARERDVLRDEQQSRLPVAEIGDRSSSGEVKVVKNTEHDYRVMWHPPRVAVGQEAGDEECFPRPIVDVSTIPKNDAIEQIFGDELNERLR